MEKMKRIAVFGLAATMLLSTVTLGACGKKDFIITYVAQVGGYVNGDTVQSVRSGKNGKEVEAVPATGYRFVGWSDGETSPQRSEKDVAGNAEIVAQFAVDYYEMPVLRIETEDATPILSKEDYVNCTVSVENAEEEYEFSAASARIRGRGNSTWDLFPKKPYKLKFDKKTDLFGNGAAKTWTLIANFSDKSLLRNEIVYAVGAEIGLAYTTTTQPVELYLNGSYDGVYLICEQTEVGKTRVDIDADINPEDQGFLLEMDGRAPDEGIEGIDWFSVNGVPYAIKGPETDEDDYTPEVTEAVRVIVADAWTVVSGDDYRAICERLDVESFAKTYVVQELFKNKDVGESSWFLYRDKGGKLTSGPLWDFDLSTGNSSDSVQDGEGARYPDGLWASERNPWYCELLKFDEFRAIVAQLLEEYGEVIFDTAQSVAEEARKYAASYERNFERWDILGTYVWPNPPEIVALDSWDEQVAFILDFIEKSVAYLKTVYPVL